MKEILEKATGDRVKEIIKLHGDASYRAYYRVIFEGGKTNIVMQMPVGQSSASEEITNFKGAHKEPPFINVAKYLSSLGLRVPKIHSYLEEERLMILEDLGDGLLAKYVKDGDDETLEKWYKKAIELLIEMQQKTASAPHPLPSPRWGEGVGEEDCVALQRSFDPYLLNWEFDHFREYLIEARLNRQMEAEDKKIFEEGTRKITAEITKIPYGFTHRDFQSRNLMVLADNSLALIDFQDALLGPCVYDLVALTRDSYIDFKWNVVEGLIKYYHHLGKKNKIFDVSLEELTEWYHLVTLQRKMKDSGRFVYIDRVKKNPGFLQFIPTSLGYVKDAIARSHDSTIVRMFEMLKKYVPEWQ